MNDLPKYQQPQSDDPDFWEVWTGKSKSGKDVTRTIDWKKIAEDWQGIAESSSLDSNNQIEETKDTNSNVTNEIDEIKW